MGRTSEAILRPAQPYIPFALSHHLRGVKCVCSQLKSRLRQLHLALSPSDVANCQPSTLFR